MFGAQVQFIPITVLLLRERKVISMGGLYYATCLHRDARKFVSFFIAYSHLGLFPCSSIAAVYFYSVLAPASNLRKSQYSFHLLLTNSCHVSLREEQQTNHHY